MNDIIYFVINKMLCLLNNVRHFRKIYQYQTINEKCAIGLWRKMQACSIKIMHKTKNCIMVAYMWDIKFWNLKIIFKLYDHMKVLIFYIFFKSIFCANFNFNQVSSGLVRPRFYHKEKYQHFEWKINFTN